jgi:tetratricopeptide (TPR) repeat protein
MFLIHGGHAYFKSPLPSMVKGKSLHNIVNPQDIIRNTLNELHKSLLDKEEPSVERGHVLHNIGLLYYDLFKIIQKKQLLDSSEYYYSRSIDIISDNTRFYYNLGRLYMESKKPDSAKKYYEKALEVKPDNILALHNLALVNLYEYNKIDAAKSLLEKVLNIDPESPVCNYVLGDIYNQKNDFDNAIYHYNREIVLIHTYYRNRKKFSIPIHAVNLSLLRSHYYLFKLYSTVLKNKGMAKKNLNAYLAIEKNEKLKKDAIHRYYIYWNEKYTGIKKGSMK